ncbi:MAG: hypothetical protein RR646_06260 [Erysipelotrichaceae bacterium]
MVVMGIFSTGIDLIPLGSILKSCNTVKSLAVAVTKDIVTSEAIGYTNSFMASCGAPPSSLIIMNLLATSVFTHYNKVSPIKDLDVTPPKVNSTNIDYIDDAFSGKNKPLMGNKYDVDPIEKLGTTEIDIKSNNEKLNNDIKDVFQRNKGASVAREIERPSWRQSELDAAKDFPDYSPQKSFNKMPDGTIQEVAYGTKGSVRPDYYKTGHSVDIKNYDATTSSGRCSLKNNISKQYNQRLEALPLGTKQTVVIDIRGQSVTDSVLDGLYNDIMKSTNSGIEIRFKITN